MKTFSANDATIQRAWYLIDATDQTLGRIATKIAIVLRGKHKTIYTPHVDTGDFVIVVNTEKLLVTGNKKEDKIYYRSTSRPGSLKAVPYKKLMADQPQTIIEKAVRGMLPKNALGRKLIKKLKIYTGSTHPHSAQCPKNLSIQEV